MPVRSLFVVLLSLGAAVVVPRASYAGDWRGFRGTDADAVADDAGVPQSWSGDENIAWTVDLPGRGLSSPIVVGGRVYVTCSSGPRQDRLHVICLDGASGDRVWERQFWATGRTIGHPKTSNAAPTPTSDGERIFAFFSSNDLICLDLDGTLQWYRGLTSDYPNASNSLGMSSSLVVADDTVVAVVENDADSFTVGVDVVTGQERWRIPRPRAANWTSPALFRGADGAPDHVLIQSSKGVLAIDPRTGETRWSYDDGASTIPSLAVNQGVAYIPSHGVTAVRPGATTPEVAEIVWQEGSLNPGTSSPVVYEGKLFVVTGSGVLNCADAATGKREWQARLEGPFSGSPVIAGGRLYIFNEKGVGFVADLQKQGALLSQHSFDDTILSTPAISDGALYIRSDARLWKIAKTN